MITSQGKGVFTARGVVYVPNGNRLKHCTLKICVAEELGRGNWVPFQCGRNIIEGTARGHYYFSYDSRPISCTQRQGKTGYVRTYARFEDVSTEDTGPRAMGAPVKPC